MRRPHTLATTFGVSLCLLITTACSDDRGSDDMSVNGADSGATSSDDQSSAENTSGDDQTTGETDDTGSETSDTGSETSDTGDGTGDTDGGTDEPDPRTCDWTNFPIQYDFGEGLGQSCGTLFDEATQDDFDELFACLEAAFAADEAAYAQAQWTDDEDNYRRAAWYVRPPDADGPGSPRRIETRYFRPYVEEGPIPEGSLAVDTCSDFVSLCDEFPSWDCTACVDSQSLPCLVDP